jgi:hypothetical protein
MEAIGSADIVDILFLNYKAFIHEKFCQRLFDGNIRLANNNCKELQYSSGMSGPFKEDAESTQ